MNNSAYLSWIKMVKKGELVFLSSTVRQFYQVKSKENQSKVQFQLELSLAQLSPSLFSECLIKFKDFANWNRTPWASRAFKIKPRCAQHYSFLWLVYHLLIHEGFCNEYCYIGACFEVGEVGLVRQVIPYKYFVDVFL